jgi:hypothetical protein
MYGNVCECAYVQVSVCVRQLFRLFQTCNAIHSISAWKVVCVKLLLFIIIIIIIIIIIEHLVSKLCSYFIFYPQPLLETLQRDSGTQRLFIVHANVFKGNL